MSQSDQTYQDPRQRRSARQERESQIHEYERDHQRLVWRPGSRRVYRRNNPARRINSAKGFIAIPIVVVVVVFGSLVIVQPGQDQGGPVLWQYVGHRAQDGTLVESGRSQAPRREHRVRNFETNHLKVNDADGNPVEIAAIVVWLVTDTSRALFRVDDYHNFVRVQADRRCATWRPRTPTTTQPRAASRCGARLTWWPANSP